MDDRKTPLRPLPLPREARRETSPNLIVFGEAVPVPFEVHDGRHHGLWFEPPAKGCKRRSQSVKNVVLHHTGGEGDADQVFRVLSGRDLSVHLFVDAAGEVWQFADLEETQCYHAGYANAFSVGIEFQCKGLAPATRVERVKYADEVHGRRMDFLRLTNAQCASGYNLIAALCAIYGIRKAFPADDRGRVRRSVLPPSEVAKWPGLLGHLHLTPSKIDPTPHVMDELQAVLVA